MVAIVSPVVVDSPEPSVWSISPPVSCRIYSKLATDPLVGTAVIGVLERVPGLILGKRYLQLVEDPAHLVIRVKPEYGSGKRPVNVKVVTP